MWIDNQNLITYVKKKTPSDNYDAYKFWELTKWKENGKTMIFLCKSNNHYSNYIVLFGFYTLLLYHNNYAFSYAYFTIMFI